jgi:hypothetical protein
MGGIGSGRSGGKETTSDYHQLDVRRWQRGGLLVVGRSFACQGSDVEVVTSMTRDEPNLLCFYRRDRGSQQREPYRVWIEWTRCNYGGERAWFVCPRGCGHCVAILYGDDFDLACRHCLRLAYDSQRDSGWHRSLRRARSARIKLRGSISLAEPLPEKPKGMHWRTYFRLYTQAAEREAAVFGGLAQRFCY